MCIRQDACPRLRSSGFGMSATPRRSATTHLCRGAIHSSLKSCSPNPNTSTPLLQCSTPRPRNRGLGVDLTGEACDCQRLSCMMSSAHVRKNCEAYPQREDNDHFRKSVSTDACATGPRTLRTESCGGTFYMSGMEQIRGKEVSPRFGCDSCAVGNQRSILCL